LEVLQDRQVRALYMLARDPGDALIQHDQKVAIELLGSLARTGNRDAGGALAALLRKTGSPSPVERDGRGGIRHPGPDGMLGSGNGPVPQVLIAPAGPPCTLPPGLHFSGPGNLKPLRSRF
jgi:hypothetical protein